MESCEQRGLRSVVWLFLAQTAFNPSTALHLMPLMIMSPAPALRIRAAPTRPACPWPASTPMSLHRCPGHDDIVPCSVPHPAQTARAASCPPCLNIHHNGRSRTALVSQSSMHRTRSSLFCLHHVRLYVRLSPTSRGLDRIRLRSPLYAAVLTASPISGAYCTLFTAQALKYRMRLPTRSHPAHTTHQ